MKIIEPSYTIETPREWFKMALPMIEAAARTCYKSEDKICEGSAIPLIQKLMMQNPPHRSVVEHFSFSVRFICDRGVSHELGRHRIASFSQESTRYCNYSKGKFGGEITVIKPCFWQEGTEPYSQWRIACEKAEQQYIRLLELKCKPQEARSVLPNSLKTEIFVTCNIREWITILEQRCSPMAHPQMRQLMIPLLGKLKELIPILFDGLFLTHHANSV